MSGATLEITGIRPASTRSSTASGRTCATSPTAEVDLLAVDDRAGTTGGEQAGVLAGEPDRQRAVLVDQADQLALDLADEHHPDDVHRLGGGDPQPAPELADWMPSRSSIELICGPPPCTTTGLKPA